LQKGQAANPNNGEPPPRKIAESHLLSGKTKSGKSGIYEKKKGIREVNKKQPLGEEGVTVGDPPRKSLKTRLLKIDKNRSVQKKQREKH